MNREPVDAWTMVHGLVGGLAGVARVPLPLFVGAIVVYELAEHVAESRGSPFGAGRPESAVNVATDLAAALGAYAAARAAREADSEA